MGGGDRRANLPVKFRPSRGRVVDRNACDHLTTLTRTHQRWEVQARNQSRYMCSVYFRVVTHENVKERSIMQLTHCGMMSGICAVFWWHFGGCVAPRRVCASAVAAWHREHHGRCWHDTRSVVYWCSIQPKYSTLSSYMCLTLCSGLFRTPIAGYKPGQRELKVHS